MLKGSSLTRTYLCTGRIKGEKDRVVALERLLIIVCGHTHSDLPHHLQFLPFFSMTLITPCHLSLRTCACRAYFLLHSVTDYCLTYSTFERSQMEWTLITKVPRPTIKGWHFWLDWIERSLVGRLRGYWDGDREHREREGEKGRRWRRSPGGRNKKAMVHDWMLYGWRQTSFNLFGSPHPISDFYLRQFSACLVTV